MKVTFEIIEEEHVIATIEDENEISIAKTITVDEFISIINESKISNSNLVDMSNFMFFTGDKYKFKCARLIEATEWAITYKSEPMIVKLPDLLFITDNTGLLQIYVHKKGDLYKFDYPNMLGQNHVCFGSFVKRNITTDEVDSYIFEYMSTPYSHNWTYSSEGGKYTIKKEHLLGKIADVLR